MKNNTYLILIIFCLFCSCNASTNNSSGFTPPPVNEDDLYARLAPQLIADPVTQMQKEQNEIVNYALDKKLDVKRLPSGMFMQVINPGKGEKITVNQQLKAHYRGTLLDGTEFDSSYRKGQPFEFPLSGMIKGWQVGLTLLKPGGKAILMIPSTLAYGRRGYPGLIAPNMPLRFDIELIEIVKQK